jgi:hypothetical protein
MSIVCIYVIMTLFGGQNALRFQLHTFQIVTEIFQGYDMAKKSELKGVPQVAAFIKQQRRRVSGQFGHNVVTQVVYKAPYAMYVHENLEMKLRGQPRPSGIGVYWGTPSGSRGQSKYLEQPFRENKAKLLNMVRQALKKKKTLKEATRIAAEWLLKQSQKLVPVEYGKLKASGFVK